MALDGRILAQFASVEIRCGRCDELQIGSHDWRSEMLAFRPFVLGSYSAWSTASEALCDSMIISACNSQLGTHVGCQEARQLSVACALAMNMEEIDVNPQLSSVSSLSNITE